MTEATPLYTEAMPLYRERKYPMPLPFGWFCAFYSDEMKAGQSMPFRLCGRDLVLFRTESGEPVALDAYCPHLGAHLGFGIHEDVGKGGRIQDDTIVCPFHGWRFNAKGECVEIPYAENMPKKVVGTQLLKSWPVVERNGVVYVWYHPEDADPLWEVKEYEEANSDEWGEQQRFEWFIRTHPQEMAENAADPAHFLFVHRTATMPKWDISYEGLTASGVQRAKMKTPRGEVNGEIHTASHGPGGGTTRFMGICETFLMGLTTPIEERLVRVRFAFMQKKDDSGSGVGKAIIEDICKQLQEDKPIWEHKVYRPLPILCDGDGPIAKFRKWYSQFYAESEKPANL